MKLVLYALCSGTPYLASSLINTHVVKDSDVGQYLIAIIGAMGVGLGITWLVPMLSFRFNIVTLVKPSDNNVKNNTE